MDEADAGWRTQVRAIVLHSRQRRVLALSGALPRFTLPGRLWTGLPAGPVAALRELAGVDVAQLWCPRESADAAAKVLDTTLVFVARDERLPPYAEWVEPAAVGEPLAGRALDELVDGPLPAGRQPWRGRDWLATAQEWIAGSLRALGRCVTGPAEQVRLCELSCVLRVSTQDAQVYFKAVAASPLFVDEGPVLRELERAFPGYVPVPLALDPARRWMLLPDLGPVIGREAPVELREAVLRRFAGLQIASVDRVDELVAAGLFDRRLDWLARYAVEWLPAQDLTRWVGAQDAAALKAAGPALAARCAQLARFGLPDTVAHGDMHLGNVARAAHGYVYFDWTDACVTHPFVDMIAVFDERDPAVRSRLRDSYLAAWAGYAPPAQLLRAWRLAAPLASLNQAISYISLVANLEPDADRDELGLETGVWLRRVLADAAS